MTPTDRTRRAVLAVLVCVVLGLAGCAVTHHDPPAAPVGAALVAAPADLVFDDEFDGPAGAGPNHGRTAEVWHTDGCWQAGCMGTLAAFRPENAQLDGAGHLVLTARTDGTDGAVCGAAGPCRWTSSRLTMLDWAHGGEPSWSVRGGHLEARIQAPVGRGLWPAFWTVGADQARRHWPASGEIDVFEAVGQRPTQVAQWIHGADHGVAGLRGQTTVLTDGDISGWHTYAVDWDPSPDGYVAWSIDGRVRRVVRAADAGPLWDAMTSPHTMILDLAVGGWAGEPDPGAFPAVMRVDWVRVGRTPRPP